MAKLLEEIHPGEILLEDFMKPMGISARVSLIPAPFSWQEKGAGHLPFLSGAGHGE